MIAGEEQIFFHVSANNTSNATNAERFADNIRAALADMKECFNGLK
jgi:hypothetical protein